MRRQRFELGDQVTACAVVVVIVFAPALLAAAWALHVLETAEVETIDVGRAL